MATLKKLTQTELDKRMQRYPEWKINAKRDTITRSFTFATPVDALAFVTQVTVYAELMQHHPALELSYTGVKIRLTTHDVQGLTAKDFDLAKRIDALRPG